MLISAEELLGAGGETRRDLQHPLTCPQFYPVLVVFKGGAYQGDSYLQRKRFCRLLREPSQLDPNLPTEGHSGMSFEPLFHFVVGVNFNRRLTSPRGVLPDVANSQAEDILPTEF